MIWKIIANKPLKYHGAAHCINFVRRGEQYSTTIKYIGNPILTTKLNTYRDLFRVMYLTPTIWDVDHYTGSRRIVNKRSLRRLLREYFK